MDAVRRRRRDTQSAVCFRCDRQRALLQQPLCVGAVGRGECERRQASGVALGPEA